MSRCYASIPRGSDLSQLAPLSGLGWCMTDRRRSPDADDFHPTEGEFGMPSISERERREIESANASGRTPVVFIHGLWLLPSSWANWADFFKQAGYGPLTPDWPDDPA